MAKGKLTPEKRAKIEKLVLDVVRALDNNKMENYKRYDVMFKTILADDKEFEKWANKMGTELDETIEMYQLPFEEMKMTQIKKAADILKLPLEEYIWYRHTDKNGIRSKIRVPVGYIHLKRTQQLLSKKNRYALDIDSVSLKTGQVTGDSKVASISDPEMFSLVAINAQNALKEFLGPRADSQGKKMQLYKQIARDGYATLEGLEGDIVDSTAINTMDVYMLASGIKTDLVTKSLKTNFTIDVELGKIK